MEKQVLVLVALLVLQGFALSVAAPKTSGSPSFDEWLATFDPSTTLASRLASCAGKGNGFYPDVEPETACLDTYTACVNSNAYPQKCDAGEVFDSTPTVRKCVNREVAQSVVCEKIYPTPACNADNVGVYQPTDKCSDLYYICLKSTDTPKFQICVPGLPTKYFDPSKGDCQVTEGAKDCEGTDTVIPPVTIPDYGCGSDKTTGLAYAITECSTSFYTCDRTVSTSPIPGSCTSIGEPGTVFNARAQPAQPSANLCVLKSTVPECK